MPRRPDDPDEPAGDEAASTTRREPRDVDALWSAVADALATDTKNPALRDPRFLRWLEEHAAAADREAPLTDDDWKARGQALRDAARRFLELTTGSDTRP